MGNGHTNSKYPINDSVLILLDYLDLYLLNKGKANQSWPRYVTMQGPEDGSLSTFWRLNTEYCTTKYIGLFVASYWRSGFKEYMILISTQKSSHLSHLFPVSCLYIYVITK